ncbi:acyltransferase [Mesorhizobium sp. PAMC28654]|uniref:acyltransferase family protein n=1 Tax=Mesorhizobium sp. PAMC28654 TaxID=2880934 RepID=UPI001D09EA73|nr:acyltransferase family protein [Mesorhizobium sp. PAMC28654]UDL87665.1 acyltransferase [Mesorhizobium sp. PAMC28654]
MSTSKFCPEIQGLRAIAVCLVAVFHVWPSLVPGGYVGVDVFFVISGYLITGVLVREGEQTGQIDLIAFYTRRARRLLPMAMLVLLLVGVLTPIYLPAVQWVDGTVDLAFSAFQLENWHLAAQSVDYLAMYNAPSPVQHYWSLSVEEQFYIVWPGLIVAGLWMSRVFGMSSRTMLLVLFGAIVAASLAASVWLTATNPASAYFVTHTRIWELGLGGLVALWMPALGEGVRRLFGFVGVAAILGAAFVLSSKTPFPGYAALLPTLATVLVVLSGQSRSLLSVFAFLKTRPLQFLGDISYSLYLWHWPIIVFVSWQTGGAISSAVGLAILAASMGLAAVSKVHVEDRFRSPRPSQSRPAQSLRHRLAGLAAALVAVPLVALVGLGAVRIAIAQERAFISGNSDDYPGASSLFTTKPVPDVKAFAPPLALLKRDVPPTDACRLTSFEVEPVGCQFGDRNGSFKVFLVGDSHAEQWVPALERVAKDRGWNAMSFTKPACPLFTAMLMFRDRPYDECLTWGRRILEIVQRENPDVIILGQWIASRVYPLEGAVQVPISATLVQLWRGLEAMGTKVIVIADTPDWGATRLGDCLAKDRHCSIPHVARPDPLVFAHQLYPHVAMIDFNDVICPNERCPAVIGNVVVWRDEGHLSATYTRSMAAVFGRRLDAAIARSSD